MRVGIPALELGKHKVGIAFKSKPFGALGPKSRIVIRDAAEHLCASCATATTTTLTRVIKQRQQFVEEFTGTKLNHISKYSSIRTLPRATSSTSPGWPRCRRSRWPISIHGEHAQGDFDPCGYPEGTLVASYNRGIKVANLSGGVKVTASAMRCSARR
ncbi:MAG: hypothetical protein U0Z44_00330 [Kouleothrix sp.]